MPQIISYRLSQCLLAAGQRSEAKTYIDAMTQRYPNSMLTLGTHIPVSFPGWRTAPGH